MENKVYDIFKKLVERWPSEVVARRDVSKFSGGAVTPKHLANVDSLGTGPDGRILVAGHVCYPVRSLAAWLCERTKTVNAKHRKQ